MENDFNNFLVSVVIPIYNEENIIQELFKRLNKTLKEFEEFEVIFVNDGSKDNSLTLLKQIHSTDERFKIINFSRNFGHQISITAGIHHAAGDAVIVMDGDLQDPPELIPSLIEKWRDGNELVYAKRRVREGETKFKLLTAKWFYRILNAMSEVDIPLDTGDFRLMDRKVVNELNAMNENHRFIRGMVSWIGFRQTALSYDRDKRFDGETKYPLKKMLKFALDGITSFSSIPLYFSMYIGFGVAILAMAYILVVLIKFFLGVTLPGYASLMVAILFLGGVQLITIGILGQYIGRIFTESKRRHLYIIEDKMGITEKKY